MKTLCENQWSRGALVCVAGLVLCGFGSRAAADQREYSIPFHGERALECSDGHVRILNPQGLTVTKDGLQIGEGQSAPEIQVTGWSGAEGKVVEGTVAFWLKPVDWDSSFEPVVIILSPLGARDGGFSLYRYRPEEIWLHVSEKEDGVQKKDVLFKYHDFKNWKKNEWHHLALVWKKGSFLKFYVDGQVANERKGDFTFPSHFEGVLFSTGEKRSGWGCAGQTLIRDFHLATEALSEGMILAWAKVHPDGKGPSGAAQPNVIPIAVTDKPPRLDGKIDDGEYSSVLGGFIDSETHVLYPQRTRLATSATPDDLYLAASLELPPGQVPISVANQRDAKEQFGGGGDFLCLFLRGDADATKKAFEGVYVTLAPNGNVCDAFEKVDWAGPSCLRTAETNLNLEVKSQVQDGVWTTELRIPFKDLPLQKGKAFLGSVGFKLGGKRIVFQDHPIWFDHYQAFSVFQFSPLGVVVNSGKLDQGVVAPHFKFMNLTASATQGRVKCSVSNPEITTTSESMDMEKKIGEELKVRASKRLLDWQDAFSAIAHGTAEVSRSANLKEPGCYLLESQAEVLGQVVFRHDLPFEYFSPISVELKPVPSKDQIRAILAFHGLGESKIDAVDLSFITADGKVVLKERHPVQKQNEEFTFSMATLAPAVYKVEIVTMDQQDKPIGKRTIDFKKWDQPAWLVDRKAVRALEANWVPKPWQPIRADSTNVTVWGRTFSYSTKTILDQLTSQKKSLLADPIRVSYTVGGAKAVLTIDETRIETKNQGRVVIKQKGISPDFRLEVQQVIEFDGMDKMTFTITPVRPLSVDGMTCEIPLKNVSYYYACPRWDLGALPQERAFGRLTWLWLGNDETGITVFAENYKGWVINSKKPRVSISRTGDGASIKLHFVNENSRIDEPLQLTFGLQPTPVKPFFKDWRGLRPQGMSWAPPPVNLYMAHYARWNSGVSKPTPRSDRVLNDLVAYAHKYHQKLYPYLTPFWISPYDYIKRDTPLRLYASDGTVSPFRDEDFIQHKKDATLTDEYFYFAEDWNAKPPKVSSEGPETTEHVYCSPSSSWTDYFIGSLYNTLKSSDVDGFYFDLACPGDNLDEARGFRYTTKDGIVEGTEEIFAGRDLYKRLYCLFEDLRGESRKPYILGHGEPVGTPISAFWDVQFHGEGLKPRQKFDCTAWYLGERLIVKDRVTGPATGTERNYNAIVYRVMHPSKQIGIPIMVLPQYAYAKPTRGLPELSREMLSFTFLHNNLLWPGNIVPAPVLKFWQSVEVPFGMEAATFYPYWSNGLATGPDCVKASYWHNDKGYLFAVANWSDKEVNATVNLPKVLSPARQCVDMETGTAVECREKLMVPVKGHDLRVFLFAGKP